MLICAARVVNLRQNIDSTSAGKFALAAIANASPTMYATFCPLKTIPSTIASTPSTTVDARATRELLALGRLAVADDVHPQIVRQRRRAGEREAGDDREDRGERHGGDEAEKRFAADGLREQRRRHVAAGVDRANRGLPDEHHRAEAEDERQQIEEADERRGVAHRRCAPSAHRAPCRTASGCAAARRCRASARGRATSHRADSTRAVRARARRRRTDRPPL